jgi:hypothetical protein
MIYGLTWLVRRDLLNRIGLKTDECLLLGMGVVWADVRVATCHSFWYVRLMALMILPREVHLVSLMLRKQIPWLILIGKTLTMECSRVVIVG